MIVILTATNKPGNNVLHVYFYFGVLQCHKQRKMETHDICFVKRFYVVHCKERKSHIEIGSMPIKIKVYNQICRLK